MRITKWSTKTKPRRKKAKIGIPLKQRFFFLLGFVAFLQFSPAYAEPQFKAALAPLEKVSLDQTCQFLIEATWKAEEGDYHFSEPDLRLENLAVEEIGESNESFEKTGQAWKKKEYRFTLKPLKPGKGKILPAAVHWTDPLGQKDGVFNTPDFEIQITTDHSKAYRFSTLISLSALTGGLIATFFRKRRRRPLLTETKELTLEDRHVSFLERHLDGFEEADQDLRDYLCEKYHLRANGATDRELLLQLESQLPSEDLKTLRKIFDKLERLNYARSPSVPAESRQLVHEIIQFIGSKRINH